MARSLVVCHSQRDQRFREEMAPVLLQLCQENLLAAWHDRLIAKSGIAPTLQDDRRLAAAEVILLLISRDFVASDELYRIAMQRALERHDRGEALVIAVLLKPSGWRNTPLGRLPALPADGRPISTWPQRQEAWSAVRHGLRQAIRDLEGNDPARHG